MSSDHTIPPALPEVAQAASTHLSGVLTPDDREALKHLLKRGTGENSLRATRSDLSYLEAWSLACKGELLPWPPARETVLRFIAHHLCNLDQTAINKNHGTLEYVL